MKRLLIAGAVLLFVGACDVQDPTRGTFTSEAGLALSDGGFGNATMNNTLVQTGDSTYRINLAQRFASEVPTTINFAFNSYQLDDQARAVLRRQAAWINQFPEVRFTVYGHTDLVGSAAYNQQLGLRRAEAAVLYLTSQGVSRSRLDAVVSHGKTRPLIPTPGPERQNRRTVTEVSGFVQSHPTVMNGHYAEIIFREYVESATAPQSLGTSRLGGASDVSN